MIDDLHGMTVFAAVAETKGFRAAGERLGVSASAVSQAPRKLEERLGVPLVQRTTRSVRLTEAGERLYASVRLALDEVRSAVAALGEMSWAVLAPFLAGTSPSASLRVRVRFERRPFDRRRSGRRSWRHLSAGRVAGARHAPCNTPVFTPKRWNG